MNGKMQKDQKARLPLLKSWEQKQNTAQAACTQQHGRGGKTTQAAPLAQPLDPPLPLCHVRNTLTARPLAPPPSPSIPTQQERAGD